MTKAQFEREACLINALNIRGRLSTKEAVSLLGISEATARRMFSGMEKQGKVVRNYGGIQLVQDPSEYVYEQMELSHIFEKQRIGEYAAQLVQNGDIIYLDCGTTVYQVALALGKRLKEESLQSVRIVTNSLANMQTMAHYAPIILVGGEYHPSRRDFSGYLSEKLVQDFHFTKCFLGTDGMSAQQGFTSTDVDTSRLNACVINRSDHAYVLLDQSKVNKSSFVSYAGLSHVGSIIVDQHLDDATNAYLQKAGVQILVTSRKQVARDGVTS